MFHRWPLYEGRDGKCEGGNDKCKFLARESANLLPILARQWWRHFRLWWPLREGRDGKCEGGNDKCKFLARESANLSPILARQWWRHFRLTTSVSLLPSLSLSLSHRLYLTHNIGSASALPIIGLGRIWSFVLGFRSLVARLVPFERGGTTRATKCLAMESVNSLRISAPQWWPLREGRDRKCEGRNEKCEFLLLLLLLWYILRGLSSSKGLIGGLSSIVQDKKDNKKERKAKRKKKIKKKEKKKKTRAKTERGKVKADKKKEREMHQFRTES